MIIFSPRVKDVITYSKEESFAIGHDLWNRTLDARYLEMEMVKPFKF
jgi:hypothetical protein